MSNVFLVSDLHFGHKSIFKFQGHTRGGTTQDEHSQWIVNNWNSMIGKRDVVWVLGDFIFDKKHTKYVKQLNGQRHLIYGNHDKFSLTYYLKECNFQTVHGFKKKSGMWLSHCPIHSEELRGRLNVHGHKHNGVIRHGVFNRVDKRYYNVNIDTTNGLPTPLEVIKARQKEVYGG